MAQVVEADLADLTDRKEPELALWAVDWVRVGRGFLVRTPLPPAPVNVAARVPAAHHPRSLDRFQIDAIDRS